jgi:hypothetical protein
MIRRHHLALHLAHRWFAFLEAPGGDLASHLAIFHPQVRLSGHHRSHLFAVDHKSLVDWFAAIPDTISAHHIIHSNYATADNGDGLLNMVVAYQAPGDPVTQGSIISYETRVEFAADGARFVALDKTPILANKRPGYETSWAANRVLARVHAELGGVVTSDLQLASIFGSDVQQIGVQASAAEGSLAYGALVTGISASSSSLYVLRLELVDDLLAPLPSVLKVEAL